MMNEELDLIKYKVYCPMCDIPKCVKDTVKLDLTKRTISSEGRR